MGLGVKEKRIVQEFKKNVDKTFPDERVRLILYGSRARGKATRESDMDLLVVTRSESWRLGDRIREMGYALELKHGIVLSIQVVSQRHMERLRRMHSQFYESVEEEGIAV